MSDNVIRLAVDNKTPRGNACTDCRHYQPNTSSFGVVGWKFLWWGPGEKPSSMAHRFAICSARGGHYASTVRDAYCHGSLWESSE